MTLTHRTFKLQYKCIHYTSAWEQRKLGDLYAKAGSGGTPESSNASYYGGDIPFLGIADIGSRYITETDKHITEAGLANSTAWLVPSGSISLAMYASVGKVGITCCEMATSQAFFNMVFDSDVTRNFVFTRLDKAALDDEWSDLVSTGTQSNLNAGKVREWNLLVPSLVEQQAIGLFFSHLDSLITLHQRKQLAMDLGRSALLDWLNHGILHRRKHMSA